MSQRFNAPPGWQVPEGFVPPTGWQPDPSWPPAPAGWNFWVDDAAPGATPADTPAAGYGPAAPGGYGDPNGFGAGPSHAPGSANVALAQAQLKSNKRTLLIGLGLVAVTILVIVVSYAIAASSPTGGTVYFPWYLGIIGLALAIRGAIFMSKSKKTLSQINAAGMAGAYGNGPASSAPMPPAGPGQPPAGGPWEQGPGQPQPGSQGEDGQRSMGNLYR